MIATSTPYTRRYLAFCRATGETPEGDVLLIAVDSIPTGKAASSSRTERSPATHGLTVIGSKRRPCHTLNRSCGSECVCGHLKCYHQFGKCQLCPKPQDDHKFECTKHNPKETP